MCGHCGNVIKVMAFKGLEWCSEICRKALKGDDHFNSEMS